MALTQGTVTVSANGTVGGAGAARSLYNILEATANASIPGGIPAGSTGYKIKIGMANQANDFAQWMVEEITLNAKATIAAASIAVTVDPITHAGVAPPAPVLASII
jgi:hypothetical protein